MFYYAQIDEQGICIAVSDLSGEVIADDMIPLDSFDTSVSGKKWDGSKWIENPNPPEPEPQAPPVTNEELSTKIDSLDQQTTALMLGMADIFSAILEGGAK